MRTSLNFGSMIPLKKGFEILRNGQKEAIESNALVVTARKLESRVNTLAKMQAGTLPQDASRYRSEDIPGIQQEMAELQAVAPDYTPGEPVIHLTQSLGNNQYDTWLIAGQKDVDTAWKTYKDALHQQLEAKLEKHKADDPKDYLIDSIFNHQYEVKLNTFEAKQQTCNELKQNLTVSPPAQFEKPQNMGWPITIKPLQ